MKGQHSYHSPANRTFSLNCYYPSYKQTFKCFRGSTCGGDRQLNSLFETPMHLRILIIKVLINGLRVRFGQQKAEPGWSCSSYMTLRKSLSLTRLTFCISKIGMIRLLTPCDHHEGEMSNASNALCSERPRGRRA